MMSHDLNRKTQHSSSSSSTEPAKIQSGQTPSSINLHDSTYHTCPLDEEGGILLVDTEIESIPEMDNDGNYLSYHNSGHTFTGDKEESSHYYYWRGVADNKESQTKQKNEENNRIRRKELLERIRIHREHIKQDAEELTRALGLPSETVYDVLAVSYGQRRAREVPLPETDAPDDQYYLEIFRRAISQRADQAWITLHQCFGEKVRVWLRSHPACNLALMHDSEDNYIALTFSRFWFAVREQQVEFPTIYAALNYLHATLNRVIIDTLRTQRRVKEVPLPEVDSSEEPFTAILYEHWSDIIRVLHRQSPRLAAILRISSPAGMKRIKGGWQIQVDIGKVAQPEKLRQPRDNEIVAYAIRLWARSAAQFDLPPITVKFEI